MSATFACGRERRRGKGDKDIPRFLFWLGLSPPALEKRKKRKKKREGGTHAQRGLVRLER